MAQQFTTGIDIGTSQVKVVIAEPTPRVIGTGIAESRGLHEGYIVSPAEVTRSVRAAVSAAEKGAGVRVKRAFVSVGGLGLSSVTAVGETVITRADMEVSEHDIENALEAAEGNLPKAASLNRRIINTIPIEFKVDGRVVWGRVEGLKGEKLEVKALFITCLEHHLQDLIKAVEEAGIEVVDIVAAPVAASFVTLSKKQKKAGCLLANIGAETLSIVVFENNVPVSLEVFPIGSTDITNDIALGLKVPLEEAESIKLGSITRTNYPKKKLDEIIAARLSDMFELIEGHLKKIGRNALLPAGIIITGGGSGLPTIKELAEKELKLPAQIADIHFGSEEKTKVRDALWSVSYGLAILAFNAEDEQSSVGLRGVGKIADSGKRGMKNLLNLFNQFLP